MLLFLLKAETSLMKKGRNLSSLAIMMNQKAFDSSILKRINNFFLEMLFFFYEYATWKWEDTVNLKSTTLE